MIGIKKINDDIAEKMAAATEVENFVKATWLSKDLPVFIIAAYDDRFGVERILICKQTAQNPASGFMSTTMEDLRVDFK